MVTQKTKILPIRFEPDDYKWLQKRAENASVSVGRYIRQVALCERGQADGMAGRVEQVEALRELKSELNKMGSNLNQIAKVANSTGQLNETRMRTLGDQIAKTLVKVVGEMR